MDANHFFGERDKCMKIILYFRFLQLALGVLILFILAAAYPVSTNSPLWFTACLAIVGSTVLIRDHYAPWSCSFSLDIISCTPALKATSKYMYDLMMTIFTAICVPLSTYCIIYLPDETFATLYIVSAVCYMFLAACFMNSLLLSHDFDLVETRPNERLPLLSNDADRSKYQAF